METLPHSAAATAATSSGKLDLRLIPPNRDQVLYPIDSAYFASHPALAVEGNDPFEMTILQLKEQIMADWHSDWENRPTETGSIRLIYMGRVLADGDKIRGNSSLFPTIRLLSSGLYWDIDAFANYVK